jgi:hypothetical protein
MRFHTELHTFVRLQDFNDLDDIVGPGIAARPEHAMHAFIGLFEFFCQLLNVFDMGRGTAPGLIQRIRDS